MTDDQDVSSRVALVTGVSRLDGIAAAVVRKLAQDGWDVAMTGWPAYDESFPCGADPRTTEQLLNEVAANGRLGSYFPADLSAASAASAAAEVFDEAQEVLGPVAAVVIVHTYDPGGGLFAITADEFDRHMAINPRAMLLLTVEFARRYGGPPGLGRIVTFTSGL